MSTNSVLVNNLCAWPLYFDRATGQGAVEIPANAKGFPLLSYDEVLAQIQLGNKMFTGTDGMGNHARIQIVDESQRKELFGFGAAEAPAPVLLDAEAVKSLLAIRTKPAFQKRLENLVKTDAEKRTLVELAFANGAENAAAWQVDALRKLADTAAF